VKKGKLVIDGVEYQVAYDFNRICEVEAAAGANLLEALGSLLSLSAAQLRGLLFAAIERDGARLTLAQVGALIRVDTIASIEDALAEAYRLSLPEKPEESPAPPAE
jgi:hypothetical protein